MTVRASAVCIQIIVVLCIAWKFVFFYMPYKFSVIHSFCHLLHQLSCAIEMWNWNVKRTSLQSFFPEQQTAYDSYRQRYSNSYIPQWKHKKQELSKTTHLLPGNRHKTGFYSVWRSCVSHSSTSKCLICYQPCLKTIISNTSCMRPGVKRSNSIIHRMSYGHHR